MIGAIRLNVAGPYTYSADSPFPLIWSLMLSNHLLLGIPIFLLHPASIILLDEVSSSWIRVLLLWIDEVQMYRGNIIESEGLAYCKGGRECRAAFIPRRRNTNISGTIAMWAPRVRSDHS